MGRIRIYAAWAAIGLCALLLAHCGGAPAAPTAAETPPVAPPGPEASAGPQAAATWVSCLPPQGDPAAAPDSLCPSPAPGQFMLVLTEQELIAKIEAAIAVNNPDGEVSDIAIELAHDAFVIRGQLQRPFRTTVQVSGRLVVRNGRLEADNIKGKFGVLPVPAGYMAEAAAEVNERLDTYFRTAHGIRVTGVQIVPGELRLTGEDLR